MPNAVPTACSFPRCPGYAVPTGRGRCATHRQTQTQRGYGADWQVISRRQRRAEPQCARCGATTDLTADHVVNGDRSLLATLCRSCNVAKRNLERRAVA